MIADLFIEYFNEGDQHEYIMSSKAETLFHKFSDIYSTTINSGSAFDKYFDEFSELRQHIYNYEYVPSGADEIAAKLGLSTSYFQHTYKKLFGIFAGYYVVQILCAIFVYGVNSLLPNVMEVMKYIGAAYILWLAIHIAFSKPSTENAEQSASFLKGFMLQFVNVKIYMFGVTALTGYVVGYMSSFPALLFFELVIATIGTIATCTWIGLIFSPLILIFRFPLAT